jgi:hypothetical protein
MLRPIGVAAATATVTCVLGASGVSCRVATPVLCGLTAGAPWTVTSASGAIRHGRRYYVYESNLSCAEAKNRVGRLTRIRPVRLLRVSFTVPTGERLSCLYVNPPKDIRSVRPRTAWGWCGTDVARVARLGVYAASGTEFFWTTADTRRN